ncbi:unnamed protein product [Durusdinium trenchii]|uniref:Uncharacterized protein n=1 Tax=Durusdinium trenchii TaxID=1381693 RepID=A0ABP0N3Z5_9DINO
MGCPPKEKPESFQCLSHFSHWEAWSPPKRHYCCAHYERACDPFDCNENFEEWKKQWSFAKKAWCCEKTKRACEHHHMHHDFVKVTKHTVYTPGWRTHGPSVVVNPQNPQDRVVVTQHTELTPGFHHTEGPHVVHAVVAGAPQDRVVVTRHTELTPGFTRHQVVADHPQDRVVTTAHTELTPAFHSEYHTVDAAGFHCHNAGSRWRTSWSTAQSMYCCKHFGLGCPFSCGGDPSTWPGSQRRWCCEHSRLGCGAEAVEKVYDCNAGWEQWQVGWSPGKKDWCCRKENRGCQDATVLHWGPQK